ncbi:hypothetical protein [Candidatus Williamhamiltonella defendens]|uniref:hypothetical protein n=1 Tax=Candidatus Williamhamiltonella defendens TaxID=138072 RepID=UPI003BB4F550
MPSDRRPNRTREKTRMDQVQTQDPWAFSGPIGPKTQNVSAGGLYDSLQTKSTLGT